MLLSFFLLRLSSETKLFKTDIVWISSNDKKKYSFIGLNLTFLKHFILHVVNAISDWFRNCIAFCLKNFLHFAFDDKVADMFVQLILKEI